MKKKIIAMIAIVFIVIITIVGYIIMTEDIIEVTITGYEQEKNIAFLTVTRTWVFYNMSETTANDILEHSDKFKCYWINLVILNKTENILYALHANLDKLYDNMWNDRISLLEWQIDLNPKERREIDLFIIVKTENMSDEEIDNLIRSVGIDVSASQFDYPLSSILRNTKTIYF